MIELTRTRTIAASPEELFALLSDPTRLTQLLPRVQRVEMLERHSDHARLATHMSIGNGFGSIRCEGELRWVEPQEISFSVQKPLPVENRWTLKAVAEGTLIEVTMSLDLKPMLGPFAQFVPVAAVADLLSKDLESTLNQIAANVSSPGLRERVVEA